MKLWHGALLVLALVVLGAVVINYQSGATNSGAEASSAQIVPINHPAKPMLGEYLSAVVQFANQGYTADQTAQGIDSSNIASEMASMMEQIDQEKLAVSTIAKYASSTDSNIATTAGLLAASETDVILKQEKALEIMRQLSNGVTPTDYNYTLAQVIASQNKRNDSVIQASLLFPYMTMDTSNMDASSTATVGPLDPSSALTPQEKSSVQLSIQMAFGNNINSKANDIFLLLAQEINLLMTSPTYADFHDTWLKTVSSLSSN